MVARVGRVRRPRVVVPGFYASLRDAFDPSAGGRAPTEREKKTLEQIDLDVERTFPENPVFTDEKRGPRGTRRILTALAAEAGDECCQGMNYIAGFAWLVHEGDEEKAFWTVFALLQNVVADRVHSHDIGGCVSEFRVLHRLIRRSLPRLHRHFEKTGTDLVMVAARWLLCFLVNRSRRRRRRARWTPSSARASRCGSGWYSRRSR